MSFKIVSHKAKEDFPQLSIFMGFPKIGKSTAMAKLPKALILDLEGKGYQGIDVEALVATTDMKTIKEAIKFFFSEQTDYKFLVLDHLRALTALFAKEVTIEHNVRFVEEVDFGRGSYQLKNTIDSFVKWLNGQLAQHPDKYVIIVAHATDRSGTGRLDIDGKNETMVLGLVDAVGFVNRDSDNETTVTFRAGAGAEYGTRNKALSEYYGPLDWTTIFNLARGKNEKPKKAS